MKFTHPRYSRFARTLRAWLPGLAVSLLALGAQGTLAQQPWPAKPIKVIVPYDAGQGTDIIGRYVANELGKELNQSVFVENRPGAGGNIGTQIAARAAPDGYTFMIGTNGTHAANSFLYRKLGFDPQADFEPVAMIGVLPLVFVTQPDSPISTVPELQRAAHSKPESLNIAISTTTSRMAYELFKSQGEAPMFPVDFKGSAQAAMAVIGGQVEYMVDTIASLRSAIQSDQVKPLGVTLHSSSKLLPGVKSLAEQGIADYELVGWVAMYAPKGTPTDVLSTLSASMERILEQPDVQNRLMQLGMEPKPMSREELQRFGVSEREKWGSLIRNAGLQQAN